MRDNEGREPDGACEGGQKAGYAKLCDGCVGSLERGEASEAQAVGAQHDVDTVADADDEDQCRRHVVNNVDFLARRCQQSDDPKRRQPHRHQRQ